MLVSEFNSGIHIFNFGDDGIDNTNTMLVLYNSFISIKNVI